MPTTLRVLATSREALGVAGEVAYRVPPLGLPDVRHEPSPAQLAKYDAIRLFAERAALVKPGFTVTARNAPAVVQICQRLDGMPLAIEFAAARVRMLSVEQIGTRLDDRLRLLTAGSQQVLPRQQTLRATMAFITSLDEVDLARFRVVSTYTRYDVAVRVNQPYQLLYKTHHVSPMWPSAIKPELAQYRPEIVRVTKIVVAWCA